MSGHRGEINGWKCDTCGKTTYVIHVDHGVTPMFLACRAEGLDPSKTTCKGIGHSLMYPRSTPPTRVLNAVAWEWYAPEGEELRALRQFDPGAAEHVRKGGLLLRKISDAGREVVDRVRVYPDTVIKLLSPSDQKIWRTEKMAVSLGDAPSWRIDVSNPSRPRLIMIIKEV